MDKWTRFFYQPCLPAGKNGEHVTGGKAHIELSRRAASEGMVLLKNEQKVLPLPAGAKVALFGKGCVDYVKGGGGSGDVTVAYVRSLLAGMRCKEKEGKAGIYEPLAKYYEAEVEKQYGEGIVPGLTAEPEIPEELLKGAKAFTDTAIITICRFSGENWDRTVENEEQKESLEERFQKGEEGLLTRAAQLFDRGDFYLSAGERKMVEQVTANFARVIVVLNVGGIVDSEWFKENNRIQSVLMAWQGGMEGGLAAADVLCGDVTPSGKLVDTFAKKLADYPSSPNFHDSIYYAEYTEDIYVGYRYFETLPNAAAKVNYPFGYGLSYTEFETEHIRAEWTEEGVEEYCVVRNIGDRPGREVVQLYVSAPQGKLGKPAKELKAYKKTRLLQPGEAQYVKLTADAAQMASYDDLGKVQKSAYVLEKGEYKLWLGGSVRDAKELPEVWTLAKDRVVLQLSSKCAPNMLKERMLADGTMEALPTDPDAVRISRWEEESMGARTPDILARKGVMPWGPIEKRMFAEVAEGSCTLEEFMSQLSVEDMIQLLCGHANTGVANTFGFGDLPEFGVPNVMTADGPAGLRIQPQCGVNTTAFPCATLLACTWDPELVEEVGAAGAQEVLENNIGVWLTPAMNIHRSPLCGRNFEYYSEDPYVAGKTGAAMVSGIQSKKIAASVKHFAVNNKETCRFESDSRVSERALREIYLKGFEITVKEADPWTIMSSYNIINGRRDSEQEELLTGILRDEWGFNGMVTTDWWNHADHYLEIKAGNDVKMGCGYPDRVKKDYEEGRVSEEEIRSCAKRVLEMILKVG